MQGDKTAQQFGVVFDVHPTQVQVWKKQLLTGAASLFETRDHAQETARQSWREAELFEQIGRLNMELDWLKKNFRSRLRLAAP